MLNMFQIKIADLIEVSILYHVPIFMSNESFGENW